MRLVKLIGSMLFLFGTAGFVLMLGLSLLGLTSISLATFTGSVLVLSSVSWLFQVHMLGHTKYLVRKATQVINLQSRGRR